MNTEKIKLTQVSTNEKNPRRITDGNLKKLINSILVFPRMLELRPIVIDDAMIPLGGNMRIKALNIISQMSGEEIEKEVNSIAYDKKTEGEKQTLVEYWKNWTVNPVVSIVKAEELTPEDKKSFIVKDNVNYGQWDEDLLQGFDKNLLGELGVMEWEQDAATEITEEKQQLI